MYVLDAGESIHSVLAGSLRFINPWWGFFVHWVIHHSGGGLRRHKACCHLGSGAPLGSSVSFKVLSPHVTPTSRACLFLELPQCSAHQHLTGLWMWSLGAACFLHLTCWPALWEGTQTQQQDGILLYIILEHPRPQKHDICLNTSDMSLNLVRKQVWGSFIEPLLAVWTLNIT